MILMIINNEISIEENSGRILHGHVYDLNKKAKEEISKYTHINYESNCHLMQWSLSWSCNDCIVDNLSWRDLYWTMNCLS